jgi:Bacterial protein of unknown function (DUF899)
VKNHPIVSQDEWLAARARLVAKEKELTRQRDQLSEERRALPWVKMEREYVFDGPNGRETLSQLFQGRSQLLIYHFMYGTDWNEGCKNCSFWADSFDGVTTHLKNRDVTMIAVSRAPYSKLKAFQKRMGWRFKWVSSGISHFGQILRSANYLDAFIVFVSLISLLASRKKFPAAPGDANSFAVAHVIRAVRNRFPSRSIVATFFDRACPQCRKGRHTWIRRPAPWDLGKDLRELGQGRVEFLFGAEDHTASSRKIAKRLRFWSTVKWLVGGSAPAVPVDNG